MSRITIQGSPRNFVWGDVRKVHDIAEYSIIEYIDNSDIDIYTDTSDSESMFHVYINGDDTNISYESLDEALLGCLERKYLGLNSNFTMLASRMLDIGKKYETKNQV
jgi:hypothetical protein